MLYLYTRTHIYIYIYAMHSSHNNESGRTRHNHRHTTTVTALLLLLPPPLLHHIHEPHRRRNKVPTRAEGRRRHPCLEYSRSGRCRAHHPRTAAPPAHQRLEPHPPGAPAAAAGPAAIRVQEVPPSAEAYLALLGAGSHASRGGQQVGSR